jgi:hypothetical protein
MAAKMAAIKDTAGKIAALQFPAELMYGARYSAL